MKFKLGQTYICTKSKDPWWSEGKEYSVVLNCFDDPTLSDNDGDKWVSDAFKYCSTKFKLKENIEDLKAELAYWKETAEYWKDVAFEFEHHNKYQKELNKTLDN